VTPPTVAHFRHLAEKLVAEKDIVELVSAALAVVSGNADIKPRSLLSSREVLVINNNNSITDLWTTYRWLENYIRRRHLLLLSPKADTHFTNAQRVEG